MMNAQEALRQNDSLKHLYPPFREDAMRFLGLMVMKGAPVCPIETIRSQALQDHYYGNGRSRAKISWHFFGLAIDCYPMHPTSNQLLGGENLDAWFWTENNPAKGYSTNAKIYETCAKSIGMTWGGDWNGNGRYDDQKFFDLCHCQKTYGVEKNVLTRILMEKGITAVWRFIDDWRANMEGMENLSKGECDG